MARYVFRCDTCDASKEFHRPIAKYPKRVMCKKCKKRMGQDFRGSQSIKFKPYTTLDVTGKPIDFTSPGQRDKILEEHGLTMDSNKSGSNKGKRQNWEEEIDFQAVKELAEKFEGELQKTGGRRTEVSENPALQHLPLYPKKVEIHHA